MNGPQHWEISNDRKSVTVTFPTDPPVAIRLDAKGVDDMLENLGEFRANIIPEHPRDWPLGQKVRAMPDPRWVTEADAMQGQSLLHLLHPFFGWLHFMFPKHEAAKLAKFLQTQAETPPEEPPGKPN